MRISNNIVLLTMGSAMLISSGVAMAAAPTSFGQYTATTGVITPTGTGGCPTGFTCGAAITGDGFLQRQITDGTNTYFQTIILDKQSSVPTNAGTGLADLSNATFADESFVQQGGGTGIADSNHVFSPSAPAPAVDQSNFTSDAKILVGTQFKSASDNLIDVTQAINDPVSLTNVSFNLTDASTNNTQPIVTIDSTVYLVPGGATPTTTSPRQRFYLKQLQATTPASLPDLATATPAGSLTGTQVSYAANDIIQVLWLGQTVQTDNTDPNVIQPFGYESFAVNPNGTTATALTPTATQTYSTQQAVGSGTAPGTNPFLWDTVFGPLASQPVF